VLTFRLARELVKRGWAVGIASDRLTSRTATLAEDVTELDGVKIHVVANTEDLRSLIRCADIVHVQFTFRCAAVVRQAIQIALDEGKPCPVTVRTNVSVVSRSARDYPPSLISSIVEQSRLLLKRASCRIIIAHNVREMLMHVGVPEPTTLIRNGYDIDAVDRVQPVREPVDVICVGELNIHKGCDILIRALAEVKRYLPNITARFVGNGEWRSGFLTLAKWLRLEKQVAFVPAQPHDQVYAHIKSAEMLVAPTLSDTWNNALLEAMLCDVPTIASDIEGPAEVLADERGVLFPVGNVAALSRAILLLRDPMVRQRYVDRARPYARSFSLDRYVRSNEILYAYLLAGREIPREISGLALSDAGAHPASGKEIGRDN